SELNALGFRVWYDRGFSGGDDWKDVVANRIDKCEAFLVLMSPDANMSESVKLELAFAQTLRKKIISFMVRPTELRPEIKIRIVNSIYIVWSVIDRGYLKELERALPGTAKTASASASTTSLTIVGG